MKRAYDAVCAERNVKKGTVEAELLADRAIVELAAPVFTLYSLGGRSLDQIYEIAVRLHVHGATPGGRLNPYKFR